MFSKWQMDKYPLLRDQVEKIVVQHGRKGEVKSKDQVLILKCTNISFWEPWLMLCSQKLLLGLQFAFMPSPG